MTKTLKAFIFGSAVIGLVFATVIAKSSKLKAFGACPHTRHAEVWVPGHPRQICMRLGRTDHHSKGFSGPFQTKFINDDVLAKCKGMTSPS